MQEHYATCIRGLCTSFKVIQGHICNFLLVVNTLCLRKNAPTLKQHSTKLYRSILMTFGRNIQKTLE